MPCLVGLLGGFMQENVINYQFIPKLNEGISIHAFDSSYDKKYIIIFENKYYMASKMFVNILNLIDGEKNIDEIYFDAINNIKYSISKEYFIIFFIKNIYEKRLLHGCESIQKKSINQSFIFYKKIFDKNNIRKITSLTKYLINKYFFVVTLIFTLISQIFFINFKNIRLLNIEALDFLIILSLLTMSAIFHEFGHASASRFYNSDCNEIGFGLYIYFFVFYSDVTNVWILKRHQRAVVDISGIYFQLIFMNFITIIYLFSGYELLERFIFISDLVIFYNLNPFLKWMDIGLFLIFLAFQI
jgi:putative peptide zinc metalloprotease protein